jgi:hypothetical protein
MKIVGLCKYMNFIFVKNLKNNEICNAIFTRMLNNKFKNDTKSLIKDFISIGNELNIDILNNLNRQNKYFKII